MTSPSKKKVGRPKLPEDEVKDAVLRIRLCSWELDWLFERAWDTGVSLSDYCRQVLLIELEKEEEDARNHH